MKNEQETVYLMRISRSAKVICLNRQLIATIIFLLNFTSISLGYVKQLDLINKKTNQWLELSSISGGYGGYHTFYLKTKKEKCDIQKIEVSNDKMDHFIDSLQKNGWTKNIKYRSAQRKYKNTIELNSINFIKMKNSDSVFQFVYKISLTNIKSKVSFSQLDTLIGTERNQVTNAIKSKDYKFDDIKIQKGTGIVLVGMRSVGLLRTYNEETYTLDYGTWRRYYF